MRYSNTYPALYHPSIGLAVPQYKVSQVPAHQRIYHHPAAIRCVILQFIVRSTQDALKHISCPTVGGALHVSSDIAARCAAGRGRKRQGAGCALVIQSKGDPQATNGRSESGHWEADTVAGKTGPSCLIDPACRKSRILLSLKFPKGTSEHVRNGIIQLLGPLPPERVRPIAPDRGKEFSRHTEISAALGGVPFYFPPPHAP